MGYFDDLSSIFRTMATAKGVADDLQHKSVAKGALDSTLQFPCLIADSIAIDKASTMSRMLERAYASFVQLYLSTNSTINIAYDKNPKMFLQRFHHNIKLESTAEDIYFENCVEEDAEYDKMMERIYNGTTKAYVNENENRMIAFNFSDKFNASVFNEHKNLLEESLAYIDFKPFPNVGNSPFYEADSVLDSFDDNDIKDIYKKRDEIDYKANRDSNDKLSLYKYQLANDAKNRRIVQMTDNDVKKSNDMEPYKMQVRLMAVNDQNEFVQFMDFIIGVKVVLHNIKSEEMIINIQNALQNNGKLFNFIRWTTGEKSLFKDLILHLNDVKLDVANRSKGASPWWMTLKKMKETSRAQSSFFSRTRFVPQSSIVLSSYEVDIIQQNTGLSLKDPKVAKRVMDTLFLMTFVIIDEGTRTVDILYDSQNAYQTYALETLEREVSMNSNKIGKELTRMISR